MACRAPTRFVPLSAVSHASLGFSATRPSSSSARWTVPLEKRRSQGAWLGQGSITPIKVPRGDYCVCNSALTSVVVGTCLFFAPGALLCLYALVVGKGSFQHGLSVALAKISRGYFQPELGGPNMPICDGHFSDLISDRPLFCFLFDWFVKLGGIWKLEFGPKAFLVISDPSIARYVLRENMFNYNKGLLAELMEPIMGKGLIPADLETWKVRRRVVTPAFHDQYIRAMTTMFGRCSMETIDKFNSQLSSDPNSELVVNMEDEFLNLALDIIGMGVFNFDFGSITKESPVIKAVYAVMKEAEHRSTFYLPYWNLPGANFLVPRLRRFHEQIDILKSCLDHLISTAKESAEEADLEALQNRDYSKVADPSLLRFLVEMRGENHSNRQLKDDLMTFLIAGHETTAAVLTWTLYLLSQNPKWMQIAVQEIDEVLRDDAPSLGQIREMLNVRLILAESLRLYPQPPLLIRRAIEEDTLPGGMDGTAEGFPIGPGADIFISTWNLHRSHRLWKDPESFDPSRFREGFDGVDCGSHWAGYKPNLEGFSLYPDEVATDFAFLPFGGGGRKCVGDQFAFLEAVVCLSMLLRRFDFELAGPPDSIKMESGATIHTKNGLPMKIKPRQRPATPSFEESELSTPAPA